MQHPRGLHLLAAPRDVTEAADVDEDAISRILNLARRAFRYTIVDTFPLLDGAMMTVLDLSDVAYIVMQGTAPNVVGIARFLPVLRTLGFSHERQRIVLNHNYKSFSGDLTVADIEGRLGRQIDHLIPYHKKVLISLNTGDPCIFHGSRRFGFGLALTELVEGLDEIEPQFVAPVQTVQEGAKATTA
jgi:pilus assembly protein CpaE